jgi:hypothetical protein
MYTELLVLHDLYEKLNELGVNDARGVSFGYYTVFVVQVRGQRGSAPLTPNENRSSELSHL